jgi:hypothetical protein
MEPIELTIADVMHEMAARLAAAQAALERGERIDLAELDRQTAALCARLADGLPETRAFLPKVEELVHQLEGLETGLKNRNGAG